MEVNIILLRMNPKFSTFFFIRKVLKEIHKMKELMCIYSQTSELKRNLCLEIIKGLINFEFQSRFSHMK